MNKLKENDVATSEIVSKIIYKKKKEYSSFMRISERRRSGSQSIIYTSVIVKQDKD